VLTTVPMALATAPMALGPSWMHADTLLNDLGGAALWGAAAVVFAECGLLIGFFMPGDSLLFTVGLFIGRGDIHYPLWFACLVLTVAAFVGNLVGYEIGRATGPAIFNRPGSRLFKQEYVDKTMQFFEDYGVRAIILARFVPIVRTFITVVAGVGRMDRRLYLLFSAIGGTVWATGITILGYSLGHITFVRQHIQPHLDLILIGVVVVSILPALMHIVRSGRRSAG
jgi:membrane-associated protein